MRLRAAVAIAAIIAVASTTAAPASAARQYYTEDDVETFLEDNGFPPGKRSKVRVFEASCMGQGTFRRGPRDEFGQPTKTYKQFICYLDTPRNSFLKVAVWIKTDGSVWYQER